MFTYLALGDSYTIGEAVAVPDRWPVQLVRELRNNGISMADPELIATTGWTTNELQRAIDQQKPKKNYDLVSLLIGVNNQYRGYPVEIFRQEFESLLQQAISFAKGKPEHVITLSIPDYGVTPFARQKDPHKIATELEQYNGICGEIAEKYKTNWFDIIPISRKAKNDHSLIAEDGLHPSGKMYKLWVRQIFPYVGNLLRMP